jgi:hypothetical protein
VSDETVDFYKPLKIALFICVSQPVTVVFKFALGLLLAFYSNLLQTQRRRGEKPFLGSYPYLFLSQPRYSAAALISRWALLRQTQRRRGERVSYHKSCFIVITAKPCFIRAGPATVLLLSVSGSSPAWEALVSIIHATSLVICSND